MISDTDPRHTSRKLALSSIFSWLFSESKPEEDISVSAEILEEEGIEYDDELTKFIVNGVKEHADEIDKIIEEFTSLRQELLFILSENGEAKI